jgi:hypothetical protein
MSALSAAIHYPQLNTTFEYQLRSLGGLAPDLADLLNSRSKYGRAFTLDELNAISKKARAVQQLAAAFASDLENIATSAEADAAGMKE